MIAASQIALLPSGVTLGAPERVVYMWAIAALVVLTLFAAWRRRRALARLASAELGAQIAPGRSAWRTAASLLVIAGAAAALVVALMRPRSDPKTVESVSNGRDIVFLVDVSRSMLAQDVAPNRLERAKLWINDLTARLRNDRVALVAFAGTSVVKCPLTTDYAFFRLALDELEPRSVSQGGTLIGDAIRRALSDVLDNKDAPGCDIILITDGEDQDSLPVAAAEQARQRRVRIIALGVGSEIGSTIPAEEGQGAGPVRYHGEVVSSKLNAPTLEQIATASDRGVFLNVGTGSIQLDRVYHDLINPADKTTATESGAVIYREHFQLFIGAALACALAHMLLEEKGR